MKEGRKPDGSLKALGPGIPARSLSDHGDMRPSVVVEARVGLLHHRVLVDGASSAVWRGRGGWHLVEGSSCVLPGRVRYDSMRDRIHIDSPAGLLEIRFRWRNTTFTWRGRRYRIESAFAGRVRIVDDVRPAVEGKTTWSGVRLTYVDPELRPIERELALGLALRAQAWAIAVAAGAA